MKYRILYEVIREVESEFSFPTEVLKKNLLDLKANNAIPNWLVNNDRITSVKVKNAKSVKEQ